MITKGLKHFKDTIQKLENKYSKKTLNVIINNKHFKNTIVGEKRNKFSKIEFVVKYNESQENILEKISKIIETYMQNKNYDIYIDKHIIFTLRYNEKNYNYKQKILKKFYNINNIDNQYINIIIKESLTSN